MTDLDYNALDTDTLIARFVAGTLRVGMGFDQDLPDRLPLRSPEALRVTLELQAIAAVLRERRPVAALRKFYDHPTWAVRHWVSGQLGSLDPEWADAGSMGIYEGLTATEVMALRARARKRPPRRPTLQEMSPEQLAARFEDAGIREFATRFFTDAEGRPNIAFLNRHIDEVADILKEVRAREALTLLLPFLDHDNITVRCNAAIYCLPIATERALAVLEPIAGAPHLAPDSWGASSALRRWRAEHPEPPAG